MVSLEKIIAVSRKIKDWDKSCFVDRDISPNDENISFTGSFKKRKVSVNYTKMRSLWIKYSTTIRTTDMNYLEGIRGQYYETYWIGAENKSDLFLQLKHFYNSIEQQYVLKYCSR
ncbi:MAG: hypothetical protein Q7K45_01345 [Nanoarchaeota archaeon]|nr:hypothetical protein [Nanoarchaeota archaeon]